MTWDGKTWRLPILARGFLFLLRALHQLLVLVLVLLILLLLLLLLLVLLVLILFVLLGRLLFLEQFFQVLTDARPVGRLRVLFLAGGDRLQGIVEDAVRCALLTGFHALAV